MATSYEYLQLLAPRITDELVVTTIARIPSEWYHLKHRDGNFYRVYMSGATSFALGLAVALPHRRVISLDADGSLLMGLTILPAIAYQNPSNLVVIVFDNQLYAAASGDKVPTFTASSADLVQIARGAGIANARLVRQLPEFEEAIDEAFQANGASFITVKVQMPSSELAPIPPMVLDYIENKCQFIRYIERTEKLQIIKPQMRA